VPLQSQKSLLNLWHSKDSDLKVTTTMCTVILQRGLCGAGVPPLWIAQDLQKQLANPHSLLKAGKITGKAVAIKLTASLTEQAVPVYPRIPSSRTPSSHWTDTNDAAAVRKPLPQSASLDSPCPIATTITPPIFLTSMTPEGKFQTHPVHTPDVHISADLVHIAAVSAGPAGMGVPGQGPLHGISRGQPRLGPNAPRGDGEAAKGVSSMTSDTTSSISGSGRSGECVQVQTAVLEPGALCANNRDVEDAIFQLSGKQMPGAQRARAAIVTVGNPPQQEKSSSSLATSATTQSRTYQRAHAWEFGL